MPGETRKRKAAGRPPKTPGEPKRATFNARLRDKLKLRLEAAAALNGRSLSEEIEYRLERSLYVRPEIERLFGAMAFAVENLETDTGKRWDRDGETCLTVLDTWEKLFELSTRKGIFDDYKKAREKVRQLDPGPAPTMPHEIEFRDSPGKFEKAVKEFMEQFAAWQRQKVVYREARAEWEKAVKMRLTTSESVAHKALRLRDDEDDD